MVDLTFVERSTLKLCLIALEKTEGSVILLKVTCFCHFCLSMLYFDCLFHNLHGQKTCALFLTKKFRDMIIIKLSIYCAYGECKNHVHFTMKNLINVGIVVTKIH